MRKLFPYTRAADQTVCVHGVYIRQIASMSSFDLGERLCHEIKVSIGDAPNAHEEDIHVRRRMSRERGHERADALAIG